MKHLHNVVISVFAKEDENIEKIKEALISLVPFNLEDEKVVLKQKTAIGFGEKKIQIFEIQIKKQKHLKLFLENFILHLSEKQKKRMIAQKESRLDEDLHFFIRLDKEKLLEGGYFIIDGGNCFHIKMSIAVFPAKRQSALAIIDKIFK